MNIAVAGAGYWGKNLVRNFNDLGVLAVVCDVNPGIREPLAGKYPGLKTVSDFREVLDDSSIEAVVIASPAKTHYAMARSALEAGKDVFVEKPLALESSDGNALVELAAKRERILFVGHVLHYHPAVIRMKEMIREGTIGKIEYIYSNRLSLGKIRREENILWSFAPHDISLILSLTGETPSYIDAVGSNFLHPGIPDVTLSNFKFAAGVSAHIFVSWLNPFKEQRLVVVGDKGMLVFEDTLPVERKLTHYPHTINWKNGIPCPEKAAGVAGDLSACWEEPLKSECRAFLEAVCTRKPPITDGAEGCRVLEVLAACQKSIEKRHRDFHSGRASGGLSQRFFAHETATVDAGARIGDGTKVWHYSHVMKGARVGTGCVIGQNVNIDGGAVVGNRVKIQNNVSVYSGVTLEDEVFLGPSCVLTNISNPRSQISRRGLYEPTRVRRGATVGANATVVCGVEIGRYAFVAAGAVVTRDVPDYALVMGNPARRTGWMSRHGHPLKEKNAQGEYRCPESGFRYRLEGDAMRCLDLDEDADLPGSHKKGSVSYPDLKKNHPAR